MTELLRLTTAGAKRAGKATLVARLSEHFERLERRSLVIADMRTADLALVVIDAAEGVVEPCRRHTVIASLLGVQHLVVCVNKMDLVDWEETVFVRVCDEFRAFIAKLEIQDVVFIPLCALRADNVIERSAAIAWYAGVPLLYHLEHVHIASDRNLIDVRLPVGRVMRDGAGRQRRFAGQVAGGVLRPGDDIVVLPSGRTSRVAAIADDRGPVDAALSPMAVTVVLDDPIDVACGDMICRPNNQPAVVRDFDATVCWTADAPLAAGDSYLLEHTTRSVTATVERLRYRIDLRTLHRDVTASRLERDDIGRLVLRTSAPLLVDDYRSNRVTGTFTLLDPATNETVGTGAVRYAAVVAVDPPVARNLTWHDGTISRERRWAALGQHGATVWLTGLSASGKSTIANALQERLVAAGRFSYVLDGDNLRHRLNRDLGFDDHSRAENVRRAGEVARLMADAGAVVVVGLISPFRTDRELVRGLHAESELSFVEVHVDAPLATCEDRDTKGLYEKARRGEIPHFTGISAPYEPPPAPDLRLDGVEPVPDAVDKLLALLVERGVVSVS